MTVNLTATSIADPAESATLSITVPKLTSYGFSPTILPAAIAGEPYSATIQVTGGVEPYTFTPTNLPAWITATPSGTMMGTSITLSGTPTAVEAGTYYSQIVIADSSTPTALIGNDYVVISTYPAAETGNGLLTGSYAFYGTGWVDGTSTATTLQGISYIGSFTADGNGNITGGELDVNNPSGVTSYTALAGTYNVQSGQTGIITLIPAGKPPILPVTLAVSLGGVQVANNLATTGNFIEFDDSTGIGGTVKANSSGIRVSGTLAMQSAMSLNTSTSPLSGSYAFGMAGSTAVSAVTLACYGAHTCGPISLAGAMTVGSGGAISAGMEDVTTAENNASQVALSGSLGNSGNTDVSGRLTASITAAGNSTLIDWPTDYVIYVVNPQMFYVMSTDSYATNSLVTGKAMLQNLADIAVAPFSSTEPIILYGNLTSSTSFNAKGPNGQIRSELQLLTVIPGSATGGSMSGTQWVNASGTYTTAPGPQGVGNFTYTVAPNGRVSVSTTGEPEMYLVDTSQGFGTAYSTANNATPGLFIFQPQTSTTLNAGNYTYSVFNATYQLGVMETGIVTVPAGGVPSSGTSVAVTGYDYTVFSETGNVLVSGQLPLYGGAISGTVIETNGLFPRNSIVLPQAIQGCGDVPGLSTTPGGGYVISSTSFVCAPSGGSFGQIHVFVQ